MKTYPAVRDPGSIELLFRNIRSKDEPEKITTDYLASIGFRRQPDVKLLELLFFLGFINTNLSPTELWKAIKNTTDGEFKAILSPAIEKSYENVLQYQASKNTTDSKVLMAFFKEETGVSDTESAYMVLTLQVLSDLADFKKAPVARPAEPAISVPASDHVTSAPESPLPDVSDEPAPGIHNANGTISLNITIPAEAMDEELLSMIKELLRKTL